MHFRRRVLDETVDIGRGIAFFPKGIRIKYSIDQVEYFLIYEFDRCKSVFFDEPKHLPLATSGPWNS